MNLLSIVLSMIFVLLTSISAHAGTATLSWDRPTTNANGTPLTDLAGFKIYYGTASRAYSQSIDVGNVITHMVGGLTDGRTYYFAVTAYDTVRNESGYSTEVSKTFPAQTFTLTVSKAGTGSGTVVSSPAGINCGVTCSQSYNNGTVITLTATPASGSVFTGWSGDADCTDGSVTLTAGKTCIAQFTVSLPSLSRLINISTRAFVGTGMDLTHAGFIISGGPKQVLIRARGPSLAAFGVTGVLANPYMELWNLNTQPATRIMVNDNWSNGPNCPGYQCVVPPDPCSVPGYGSANCNGESSILITLPAGAYTAIESGVAGQTGVGLVEINEAP